MFEEKDCHVVTYEDGKKPAKILVPKEVKDITAAIEIFLACQAEEWVMDDNICGKLCPLNQKVGFPVGDELCGVYTVTNICGLVKELKAALKGGFDTENLDQLV